MSSKEVVDAIRRIVAVRDGVEVTVGYEQAGLRDGGAANVPYAARPDIDGKRGRAGQRPDQPGGIASPLTEVAGTGGYAVRETYPTQLKTSSDGLFVFSIRPIKRMSFTDAGGASVDILLALPHPDPTP